MSAVLLSWHHNYILTSLSTCILLIITTAGFSPICRVFLPICTLRGVFPWSVGLGPVHTDLNQLLRVIPSLFSCRVTDVCQLFSAFSTIAMYAIVISVLILRLQQFCRLHTTWTCRGPFEHHLYTFGLELHGHQVRSMYK